jgi:hypothetical protein
LEERLDAASWTQIHNDGGTTKVISDKTTGSWGYRARACNAAGCSAWSSIVTTAVTRPPALPVLTLPSNSDNGTYAASWVAVAHTVNYQLQERVGTGSWTTIHDGAATQKWFLNKPNGTYGYQLRACNSAGCSAWTAVKTVTVVLALPTQAPSNIYIDSPVNAGEPFLMSWSPVQHASEYQIDRRHDNGSWEPLGSAVGSSATLWAAGVQGPYYYRIRGCSVLGCGPYGTTSQFVQVPGPICHFPPCMEP